MVTLGARSDLFEVVAEGVTAEQLFNAPPDAYRYELVKGVLYRMSPATFWHGHLITELAYRLSLYLHEHPAMGQLACNDPGFTLERNPDTVLAPDIAFLATEQLPPNLVLGRGFVEGEPTLAIEVVSPNDRWSMVRGKVETYLAKGTALVWVIDPLRQTAHAYRLNRAAQLLKAERGDVLS